MLEININKSYKSINAPSQFELPSFVVLTGKNGSGKTHLIEAISKSEFSTIQDNGAKINNIKYIAFNGLNPIIKEQGNIADITNFVKNVWKKLETNLKSYPNNIRQNAIVQNLPMPDTQISDKHKELIHKIIREKGITIDKLTEEDLHEYCDASYMNEDFFTAQFALIFINYHKLWVENEFEAYLKTKNQNSREPLAKDVFYSRYGTPPWDFVNKILSNLEIPYQVNSPKSHNLNIPFNFCLKDENGVEIHFPDLSTGEKVLMSLALAIYNTNGDSGKPNLLLIDEPDAALHPSMSIKLIEVLNKEIVKKGNIPVIITTHSPTTVIAASGIPIYIMNRGENHPIKTTTQFAIEELSSGIPFLRISNDKRRQVFVESKYDVEYYEQIVNIIARKETLPSEPIFLPARTSDGSNCDDVKKVVRGLYNNGNTQVYGIIDWDTQNSSGDRILVLGEGKRYAIENYLLDPLLMGLLFLRERKITATELGITSFLTYVETGKMSEVDAQRIIDKVLSDLGLFSENRSPYKLHNGWTLLSSDEFNLHQGHNLEALYKSKYQFLNAYRREDALKNDIVSKVIDEYSQYAPQDIFDLIQQIE